MPLSSPEACTARATGGVVYERALDDRVVERRRLVQRAHAELTVEHADAIAVLLHRRLPIADLREEPDQLPMRRLVQGIEGEPAPRASDGLGRIAARRKRICEPVEHRGDLALDFVACELLPVVESGAVPQPEAREERATVEGSRLLEWRETPETGLIRAMPVLLGRRDQASQLVDVQPDSAS